MRIHADFTRFAAATDAEQLATRVGPELTSRLDGVAASNWQVVRVLPRKRGGYTIQYRIPRVGGAVLDLGAQLLGDGEAVPVYVEQAKGAVIHADDLGLVMPVFPYDPKLKALPRICSPTGAAELLATGGAPVKTTVLAYRLEKRCVIRYEQPAGGAADRPVRRVVKTVPRSRLARFVAGHRQLAAAIQQVAADHLFTIPEILRVDERLGAYVMEDVPGTVLFELREETAAAYAAAGSALRGLHALPRFEGRVRTRQDELAQLAVWTARIAPMFPDVTAHFAACEQLVRDGANAARLGDEPTTVIHGDFYDKQVLYSPARTTVLDTDNLACGDPAQDLGNFSAHVRLRQLQDPHHAEELVNGLKTFTAAYGEIDGTVARRAVWWRSATLLRLAGLYALRPRWRHLVPSLLEEIDSCARFGAAVQ